MIAAVISTLTSVFNSSSTLFTLDIWGKFRPRASQRELLLVGRLFIVLLTFVSVLWIPIMSGAEGGEIYKYATAVIGYFGAPTCVMFVFAMFWNRTTEPGAFWGMLIAQVWGIVRFILDLIYPAPPCGQADTRPGFVSHFHAYYHTVSQIILGFLAVALISICTERIPEEKLAGLTFLKRFEKPLHEIEMEKMKEETKLVMKEVEEPSITASAGEANACHRELEVEVAQPSNKNSQSLRQRFITAMIGPPSSAGDNMDKEESPEQSETYEQRFEYLQQSKCMARVIDINGAFICVLTIVLFVVLG